MNHQEPSAMAPHGPEYSTQSKQQKAQKTVAHLLDDKDALSDWVKNIEKIRKLGSDGVAKHAS